MRQHMFYMAPRNVTLSKHPGLTNDTPVRDSDFDWPTG